MLKKVPHYLPCLSYAQTHLANNGMLPQQSPFIEMINVSYCGLEEQTLTLLLRSVRANCALKVLKLQGNNLSGKGTFILSEQLYSPLAMQVVFALLLQLTLRVCSLCPLYSGCNEVQ